MRTPMLFRTAVLAATALLALGGLAACGDDTDGSQEDPSLSVQGVNVPASDLALVLEAETRVQDACGDAPVNEEGADQPLGEAIDELIAVYERNPDGIYAPNEATRQRSMGDVLQDNAQRLDECGEREAAARLREALEGEGG